MKLTIEHTEELGWVVKEGNRIADKMGWEEMLGLVATITMPEMRPCQGYIRSNPVKKIASLKAGETIRCKKNVVMEKTNNVAFVEGRDYRITGLGNPDGPGGKQSPILLDEQGDGNHYTGDKFLTEYFEVEL
jgi:hypothetical protein